MKAGRADGTCPRSHGQEWLTRAAAKPSELGLYGPMGEGGRGRKGKCVSLLLLPDII